MIDIFLLMLFLVTIAIWVAIQVLRLARYGLGVLVYLGIWLFAPRTWREMHDAERR